MQDTDSTTDLNRSLSMFSVLTLTSPRGLGSTTLSRHETFPARQLDHGVSKQRNRPDWVAAQVPKNRGHLTLELGERIGSGRSADVYVAKVVTAILRDDGAPGAESPLSSELCVKVARPNRCRSLAREAWVYEQLAERALQGVITPNCYGFFTTTLAPEQLPFPLWSNEDSGVDARPRDKENDDPTRDDSLCDDVTWDRDECTGYPPGGRELSPWVDWRPDPDSPCVSALVMARGGAKYSVNEDEWDQSVRGRADSRRFVRRLYYPS
ncbi:uncharacterized protein B0H18DRAFT_119532 [Fomitopsis serialis]|uniref:uncharacterized protein n=1 Tax=Fomitopsis serialis TaxID=139415 RepID=UPI002008450A|nr:uncharacterized protein B0H18DRAFT_119532 [Neoantrodia serialis]KAH9930939.1 hypothetical protein B0H18DRAFT_119532 [Neoantrodia serialis]